MSSRLFAQLNVKYNKSTDGTVGDVIVVEVEELDSLDCDVEATEVATVEADLGVGVGVESMPS